MNGWRGGLLAVFLLAVSAGCGPQATPAPIADTPLPSVVAPTAEPVLAPASALDEEALQQVTLTLPETGTITLRDGAWVEGEKRVRLLDWAAGWLTYDGSRDAVAAFSLNLGGSGHFVYLAVFNNQDGLPVQQGQAVFLADRPELLNLSLVDGLVFVEARLHWGDDPLCCPQKSVRLIYHPWAEGLRLQSFAAATGETSWHEVRFLRLAMDDEWVSVYGVVTVMPFENTLVYRWRTLDGQVLAEGPLQAQPDDPNVMGGSGTFTLTLPWPTPLPEGPLWLEVYEPSMRDGSWLTLYAARVR